MTIPTNNPGTGSTWKPVPDTRFVYEHAEFCTFHINESEFSFRIPFCQRDNASMKRIASMFEAWREQFSIDKSKPSI